jgi:hypothetical protein
VAIVNAGNRQGILMESQLQLFRKDHPDLRWGGGEATKELPIVLDPKKIILLRPRLDISSHWFMPGIPADSEGNWVYTLAFELTAVDSTGKNHSVTLPVQTLTFDKQLKHIELPIGNADLIRVFP